MAEIGPASNNVISRLHEILCPPGLMRELIHGILSFLSYIHYMPILLHYAHCFTFFRILSVTLSPSTFPTPSDSHEATG